MQSPAPAAKGFLSCLFRWFLSSKVSSYLRRKSSADIRVASLTTNPLTTEKKIAAARQGSKTHLSFAVIRILLSVYENCRSLRKFLYSSFSTGSVGELLDSSQRPIDGAIRFYLFCDSLLTASSCRTDIFPFCSCSVPTVHQSWCRPNVVSHYSFQLVTRFS